MKTDGSSIPLTQLNVVSGVSLGAQGTTSVAADNSTKLNYLPAMSIVTIERKGHPLTLVPLSNVRYMRVDEVVGQPANPQVKR
jgi:hypothetical protein